MIERQPLARPRHAVADAIHAFLQLGGIGFAGQEVGFGFLVFDTSDPNKPVTLVKVLDAKSGAAKAATVATGYFHNVSDQQSGVTFRPGGADLAVRTGDGTVLVVDASKLKEVKNAKPEGKKE